MAQANALKSKSSTRREREKENLRKMITDVARDILIHDGHDAISLRNNADRIEYSPATLYLHFRDKDSLLHCLIKEGFDELYTRL